MGHYLFNSDVKASWKLKKKKKNIIQWKKKATRGSDGPSSAHTFKKTRKHSPVKLGHTLGEEMLHTGMFNNNKVFL